MDTEQENTAMNVCIDGVTCGPKIRSTRGEGEDASPQISIDSLISKLRGANESEKLSTLSWIINEKFWDIRLIPSLLDLLQDKSLLVFEKAAVLLVRHKENKMFGLSLDQKTKFDSRFNGAEVLYFESDRVLKIKGKNFTLPNGVTLQEGTISFKDGRIFIPAGDYAGIENLKIGANEEELSPRDKDINLYFDGEAHENHLFYVSLDSKKRKIVINSLGNNTNVTFLPGNKFIDIKEKDFFGLTPFYSRVTIQKKEKDMPSQITVSSDGKHGISLFLINGNNRFLVDGNFEFHLSKEKAFEGYSSTPVTLILQDENDNNVFEKTGPEIISFDRVNQFIYLPEKAPDYIFAEVNASDDFNKSMMLQSYLREQILRCGINMKVISVVENAASTVALGRIFHALKRLSPNLKESLDGMKIVPDRKIDEFCDKNAGGCADQRTIIIPESADLRTISHEAGHTLEYKINEEEGSDDEKVLKAYERWLKTKYKVTVMNINYDKPLKNPDNSVKEWVECEGVDLTCFSGDMIRDIPGEPYASKVLSEEEKVRWIQNYLEVRERLKDNFVERWQSIADDVYGKDLGPIVAGLNKAITWKDGKAEPRNGCVRPYGANNPFEDIATFVEKAHANPELFGLLINPSDPLYDPRYLQKLTLLKEYGFITEEQFNQAVK